MKGNLIFVEALLKAGANGNAADMIWAARKGNLIVIEVLLKAGADVNAADEARLSMTRRDAVATYSGVREITSVADLCGAYLVPAVVGVSFP